MARMNATVEPLPLVPATWITGGKCPSGWPSAANSYIIEGIEQVWLNRTTGDAFLNRLQTVFTQELREGRVPPLPPRTA